MKTHKIEPVNKNGFHQCWESDFAICNEAMEKLKGIFGIDPKKYVYFKCSLAPFKGSKRFKVGTYGFASHAVTINEIQFSITHKQEAALCPPKSISQIKFIYLHLSNQPS
ncbi:MAG: hypothetical protein VXB01_06250 [Opitutae bacterium]